MNSGPRLPERRKHARHPVTHGAFVINTTKPGRITDISLNGLSWRYIDRKGWPEESSCLDIVVDDFDLRVEKIPYEVITDHPAPHDYPDGAPVVRRRSVRFGQLSARQRTALEALIRLCLPAELAFS